MKTAFVKAFATVALIITYGSLAVTLVNIVRECIAYKKDPTIIEINKREREARIPDRVPPIIEEEDRNPDGIGDYSLKYEAEFVTE